MHTQKREENPTFSVMEQSANPLRAYDVVCGRHKAAFDNIGNRRFRVLVALAQDKYTSAPTRAHKTTVIRSIIDSVHNGGGRFLQRLGCSWVELDAKQTHDKVGHALRDMAVASKTKTKPPTHKSYMFSIQGTDQSLNWKPYTVPLSESISCLSQTDDISAVCSTMNDGYVVNFSCNGLITEDQQYLKEAYLNDRTFMADGPTQCHQRTSDYRYTDSQRTSEISQNLFPIFNDRTFVV